MPRANNKQGPKESQSSTLGASINTLSGEFDALLARMQQPAALRKMQAGFRATPEGLGKGAVEAARTRG
jgi:hypothetical protein